MRTHFEFQAIARVGKITAVGSILKVSLAAEYGKRNDRGDFESNPFWNTVTIFNEATIKWVKENVGPGDLVHPRGTARETSYEKNGETIYGVTFACDQFDRLAKKAERQDDQQ